MDIQISSNFERLLFDLLDMRPGVVEKKLSELKILEMNQIERVLELQLI